MTNGPNQTIPNGRQRFEPWRTCAVLALLCLLPGLASVAPGQELLKEAVSREFSVYVGGDQTPLVKDIASREVSLFIGADGPSPYPQAVSREVSVVITTPAVPQRVMQLTITVSPTGDAATLDWSAYNEIAENDVVRYRVYVSTAPFMTVSNLTPSFIVPAGAFSLTITNLAQWQDHYFAVVAEDALGGYDPTVNYSAAYVLAPEAISRELALFVGAEPASPYAQAISREMSLLMTTPAVPDRITQLAITVTPTGDGATLDWSAYNEIVQNDVVRYNVYVAAAPFTVVTNLAPYATVAAGTFSLTITNLTAWQDHYFAVVAVDGLGGYDPVVNYAAAYVLAPQAITRELSMFVGAEPAAPYRQAISRELAVLVPDAAVPDPVTGLNSGFTATMSVSAFSAIDLDWSSYNEVAQHDVVRYRIYAGPSFYTDVSGMSPLEYVPAGTFRHTVGGLHGSSIYYMAVVAEDALGQWNPTVRSVSAQASIGALGEVQNLAVTSFTNSITLTWTAPAQVDAFLARYNLYVNGATNPIALDKTATSYSATGLQPATGYAFRLSTVDAFGTESAGVSVQAATLLDNPNDVAAQSFDGMVRLTWSHVEPNDLVKYYAVYRAGTNFTSVASLTPVLTTRGTRADISGLANGTPYFFAVTTVNIVDGQKPGVRAVTATPNPVSGQFADLVLTNVTGPASAYSGQTITINWSVTNTGTGSTSTKLGSPVSSWSDRAVLSPDSVYGNANDVLLTNITHTGALNAGSGYAGTATVQLPTNLLGNFFVFVMANAAGQVYEYLDYGTNLGVAPQQVVIGPPGRPFITQQPLDQAVFQGYPASFSVVAGGSPPLNYQWRHGTVALPAGTNATLVLSNAQFSDAGSYVVQISNPAGATNSRTAILTVNPPPPDLFVLSLQAPTNLSAGQPVPISWLVTNAGFSTAISPWRETLLLAKNPAGTNATPLFTLTNGTSLAAGSAVTRTQTVILPAGLSGTYWLAVQVDSANQVAEGYGETNNLFVNPQPIQVQSPDLQVSRLTSPATAALGQPFTVSWVVQNTGTATASGSWNDRLFLSASSNSFVNAVALLNSPAPMALAPGASYTNTQSVTLALDGSINPGNYFLVLQADADATVAEFTFTNNSVSAPLALTLPPLPDLAVGQVVSPTSAVAGQTIAVSWAVTNVGAASAIGAWRETLYLVPAALPVSEFATDPADGRLIGAFNFTNNLAVGTSLVRTQQVVVPLNGPAGDLRLAVFADVDNALREQNKINNAALAANDLQVPAALTLSAPVTNVVENTSRPNFTCLVSRNGDLTAAVSVSLLSGATNHLRVPATVTIAAGSPAAPFIATVLDDGVFDPDTWVTITVQAGGYLGATSQVLVVNTDLPRLGLGLSAPQTFQGQTLTATVTRDTVNNQPVLVTIAASSSTALSAPPSVTIPANSNSVSFPLLAVDSTVIAPTQIYTVTASAAGYASAATNLAVLNHNIPTLALTLDRTNISKGDGPFATVATVTRQPVTDQPLTLALGSTNPGAATVPAGVTIPGLQAQAAFYVAAVNDGLVTGPKITLISAQAQDALGNLVGVPATQMLGVQDDNGPALKLRIAHKVVGKGLNPATMAVVWRNTPPTNNLVVALASSATNEAVVPPSVTMPSGQTNATFNLASVNDGVTNRSQSVTITASATNHASGSDTITVTDLGLPDLVVSSITAPAAAFTAEPATVIFRLANQGLGPLTNAVTQNVFLTANPQSAASVLVGTVTFSGPLGAGQYADQALMMPGSAFASPGTYWVVVTADANNQATELNKANNSAISSTPTVVTAEYTATVKAGVTNVPAGTPVPLAGSATLVAGGPAANRPVNILLTVRGFQRTIGVFTDNDGNFSTLFMPLATEAGHYTVSAVSPGITSAPAQDQFTIYGMTLSPVVLGLTVTEGASSRASVSVQNLSDLPLTGMTATVSGLAANLDAQTTFSTNTLPGLGSVTLSCTVSARDATIRQSAFNVHLTSTEGVALDLPVNITVQPLLAQLVTAPSQLSATMLRGAQSVVQFDVLNVGAAASGPLTVNLPAVPWLSLAITNPMASLPPGASNRVTLVLTAASDLALGPYTGALTVSGSGVGLTVPFSFTAVSDARGSLRVHSTDEFTYFASGTPSLTNASVTLIEPFSRSVVASGLTDTNGLFLATNLTEGIYELDVTADKHAAFHGSALVTAAQTNDVEAFLSRQTVQFTWIVEPTQIQDVTHITIQAEFEANVPAPVVVPSPTSIDLASLDTPGKFMDVLLTLANYGLVAVHGVTINITQNPLYQFDLLTHDLGVLPAHGTVTVPMRITRVALKSLAKSGGGDPCTNSFIGIGYLYLCGENDVKTGIAIPMFNVSGDCLGLLRRWPHITIDIRNPFRFRPWSIIIPPPIISGRTNTCDQCMAKAIVECAIGYLPGVGDAYNAFQCGARAVTYPTNESTTETCVIAAITIAGNVGGPVGAAAANTAACLWNFLRCKCPQSLAQKPGEFFSCVEDLLGQLAGGLVPKDATVGLGLSATDPRDVYAARSYPELQFLRLIVGDTDERWLSPGSGAAFGAWYDGFSSTVETNSPAGALISADETATLLALPRPSTVTDEDVQNAIARWNLTLTNWRAGLYSLTNVPTGGNTNFIDLYILSSLMTQTADQYLAAQAAGYDSPQGGFFAAFNDARSKLGSGGVCARVVLQLDQDAVLTRDAFRATLQLNNSGTDPLLNLGVRIVVQNQLGQDVTSLFGILPPTLTGDLYAVDGTGVFMPNAAGSAQWTLIPTLDAAPQAATNYLVSGTLNYVQNGVAVTIPLAAAPITVQPNPQLYVKYFHQRDVFADDPYTPAIEPSIPYSLAVMVQNHGYGAAHDFKITSAQPKIVDNQKGLLIDFKIIGSQVGNQPVAPSLTTDFGDIPPGGIKVGRWLLTSTLQGLFIDYKATFQHVDPLGNPRLSLVDGVEIHEMNHLVHAEGAWDDGLPDFLVNDQPDFNNLPDTLYLSDGTKQPVSVVQSATPDAPASAGHLQVQLTAVFPAGFTYVQVPDPGNGQFSLQGVRRSNGTNFLAENFWTTDRTFVGLAQPPIRENVLHLLDYHTNAGPDTYTLVYAAASSIPQTNPPVSSVFALPARSPTPFGVVWSGANYVGQASLAWYDIYSSDNGGPFTVWQPHTTTTGGLFDGLPGHTYAFYSVATDTAGNVEAAPAAPQATTTVSLSNTPPTISFSGDITVNEGDTVLATPTVSDSDLPPETFTFSLVPGAPLGVVVDPATGQLRWATIKGNGGTTNRIGVVVTDNGFPPLSATGFVTVVVKLVNTPPILAPIASRTINEGFLLRITNSVTDYDIPRQTFTWRLGVGAPAGTSIDPTNGIFSWRPDSTQGPSTNLIAVIVTDNGVPPLGATLQFTVVVRDVLPDLTLSLGSTNVMVGESNFVPLTLASTLDLTNVSFRLSNDTMRLTNLALLPVASEVTSASLQFLGSNLYSANLTLDPSLQIAATRTLARLTFAATPAQHSAIAPLNLTNLAASRQSGAPINQQVATGGRVIVVGAEPVLDIAAGPVLTLYGHPGTSYALEYRTNLVSGTSWSEFSRLSLGSRFVQVTNVPTPGTMTFYRAREVPSFGLGLQSIGPPLFMLTLHGQTDSRYRIQSTTNLTLPWYWSDVFTVTLTNSIESWNWTNLGETMRLFRALSY